MCVPQERTYTISVKMSHHLGGLSGLGSNSFSTVGGLTCDECDDFNTPAIKETRNDRFDEQSAYLSFLTKGGVPRRVTKSTFSSLSKT